MKEKQAASHKQQKEKLAKGLLPHTAIIVQDFSALDTTKKCQTHQDLIITIYKHDATTEDGLCRQYLHFVGEKKTKNNVDFVISAWETLRKDKVLEGIQHLHIWSDGGPKHFKMSANIYYCSILSTFIPTTYHFFASYHGQSACDAAASHAKRRINVTVRDQDLSIATADMLSMAINTVRNHKACPVEIITTLTTKKFKTITGITQFHKYSFNGIGKIYGYDSTDSPHPTKMYNVKGELSIGGDMECGGGGDVSAERGWVQ